MEKEFTIPISRREFMKIAGLAGIGTILSNVNNESQKVEAATESFTTFEAEKVPILMEADVCVVGGGPSGTAAAINSAKNGLKTVLIERGIALGGLAVLGCVNPFMDTHAPNSDTPYVAEIKKRLIEHGINYNDGVTQQTWFNPEILSLIYDEYCEEVGVNILYQTVLVDARTNENNITTCIIQTIAGLAAIKAKIFIDSSGDAYLAR